MEKRKKILFYKVCVPSEQFNSPFSYVRNILYMSYNLQEKYLFQIQFRLCNVLLVQIFNEVLDS